MGTVALDDRDPAVAYSTGWAQAGMSLEYNSTTTWTEMAGAVARVSFHGSSIGVYGTIIGKDTSKEDAPESYYSIDGGSLVSFTADKAASTQYRQLFFQSPLIPEAAHVLNIVYTGVGLDPLFLDYFMVNGTTLPASSITSLSSSSSASLSTSTTPTTTPSPVTITVTPVQATSTSTTFVADGAVSSASNTPVAVSSAGKSNAAAVVGGIIGGTIVLFLAVFALIKWRRRRARRDSLYNFKDHNGISWVRPIVDSPPSPIRPAISLNSPPPPATPVMSQHTAGRHGDGYYPGGYASANNYHNYQQQQPAHLAYNYTHSEENGAYGGVAPSQQPYPQPGYIPPSQLLHVASSNDHGDNNPQYTPPSSPPNYASGTYPGDHKTVS